MPDTIHTVLTDHGVPFTVPPRYADGPTARHMTHMFDRRCQENGIEHRLTKVTHSWTNGQVDRLNRTIKEATVKRFHDDDHAKFEMHLADFIAADTFGRRLKTLRGLTPYEYICKVWTSREYRDFRVWAMTMDRKETSHGTTQTTCYPGRAAGPVAGWNGREERV